MGSAVSIRELVFTYPNDPFSLKLDQLEIAEGEQVAITGTSGCGKTTLAHLISGIVTPDSGEVEVLGRPVHQLSDAECRAFRITSMGFIFQQFELLDYLKGHDNLFLPYYLHPALKLDAPARARALHVSETLGINHLLNKHSQAMSQGEQQRLAIARALLPQPKLLLADEPTGNLDPDNSQRIMELLHSQARDTGATLLTITHDQSILNGFDRTLDLPQLLGGST